MISFIKSQNTYIHSGDVKVKKNSDTRTDNTNC